jgi:HAD superfamily hydrolase (TIGR01509 family)
MTPRAIFLDFDGTLVDSEPLHHRCWCEAVEPWGGGTDWEDYRNRFVGITDREAGRILLAEAGHNPTDALVLEACRRKHTFYRARCQEALVIAPETLRLVSQLAQELPISVVSSSITSEVAPVLEKAGLAGSIHVRLCGDDVDRHKPDPKPYLVALDRLRSLGHDLLPADCVAFEDSRAGIASAQAAGMRVRRVRQPHELSRLLGEEFPALVP